MKDEKNENIKTDSETSNDSKDVNEIQEEVNKVGYKKRISCQKCKKKIYRVMYEQLEKKAVISIICNKCENVLLRLHTNTPGDAESKSLEDKEKLAEEFVSSLK